jgi:3-deoxy-D-manno-octulosonic-acid transferase
MRLRWLWKPLMAKVAVFLAQSEETAERLRRIGVAAERVRCVGNLKFDLRDVGENAMTLRIGSLLGASRLMVAGSTLAGEEQILLDVWPRVLRGAPDAILLVAPRHPDRFSEVSALLAKSGFNFVRASAVAGSDATLSAGSLVLLDTIGDLASIYSKAKVAFIGGSLVPAGGHNPLEAARFGVPVLIGESYENFRDIVEGMKAKGAIHIVDRDKLSWSLIEAPRYWKDSVGRNGLRFFEAQRGATGRTVAALLALIAEGGA